MSREQRGGLSLSTLLLASAGAATASIVVPLVVGGGGVVAAAITPIIVTLTSEALKKPVQKVQTVGVWRRTPQGTVVRQPTDRAFEVSDPEEERIEVDPEQTDDPFGLREPERKAIFTRRRTIIALTTAALAFALAAVVVTAGQLTFGGTASKTQRTTFFGGRTNKTPTPTPTPTETPGASETPTPTPSASATPTVTPTPSASATPAPTPGVVPNAAPAPGATPPPAATP